MGTTCIDWNGLPRDVQLPRIWERGGATLSSEAPLHVQGADGGRSAIRLQWGPAPDGTPQPGLLWVGLPEPATTPSFDGTPIDVAVGFPAATGVGQQLSRGRHLPRLGRHEDHALERRPRSAGYQRLRRLQHHRPRLGLLLRRAVDTGQHRQGRAVRTRLHPPDAAARYEVRDAQTLLGKLADEGLIDPQQIGATGGSYGGGMSLQLGSLKDRVELPNGELDPVDEPARQTDENRRDRARIPVDATSRTALQPERQHLDYVANAPYSGINGDHRFGIEKNNWNGSLYLAGPLLGYYAPTSAATPKRTSPAGTTSTSQAARTTANRWRSSRKNELPSTTARTTRPDRAARAGAAWRTAGTTTCSRSTKRSATTTRSARTTRTSR